jgi:magnesium transporter
VLTSNHTADLQKAGGMEALDQPYLEAGLGQMLRKRAGWLAILFAGELLTASVMAGFEERLAHAVVLATFVPLVISSGGNAGSQAAMLVTRALALGDVRPGDALRVAVREGSTGLALGGLLAGLGLARVLLWQGLFGTYGERVLPIALTLGASLLGVVAWGTLAGAMLPLLIRRAGFDPASASAPFVATLVDVSGLALYFTLAGWLVGV